MITLMSACEKVVKLYFGPDYAIHSIGDTGSLWIFSSVNKQTGEIPVASPLTIDKVSGNIGIWFPPEHTKEELESIILLEVPERFRMA